MKKFTDRPVKLLSVFLPTHVSLATIIFTTTILRLSEYCLGQPGWAGTRRNIHPLAGPSRTTVGPRENGVPLHTGKGSGRGLCPLPRKFFGLLSGKWRILVHSGCYLCRLQ